MNTQLLGQLAAQRVDERRRAAEIHRQIAASRPARESIRERAGWTLIHAGLKLTGPPAPGKHAQPRPASL